MTLASLVAILDELVIACLPDAVGQKLLKVLTRFYKVVAGCAQYLTSHKQEPSDKYLQCTETVARHLTPDLYPFITFLQNNHLGDESRAKIQREISLIPNMIFQVEKFEQCTIRLQTVSKVNMTHWFKRSIARDFRFRADALNKASESDTGNRATRV